VSDWRGELEALASRGVWDPEAPDGDAMRALVVRLLDLGLSVEEIAEAEHSVGDVMTDAVMRPRGPGWMSLAEAAAANGLTLEEAHALWRALGFTEADDGRSTLSPDEVELLALFAEARTMLGDQVTLQVLRSMSSGIARVAQSELDAFRIGYEVPALSSGVDYAEVVDVYSAVVRSYLPRMDAAMATVHRRHIVVQARQEWGTDDEAATIASAMAVGFADLVGFTDRSVEMSTRELGEAVSAFDALAHDVVHDGGASVVKLIGDEVMFVAKDPAAAARVALALTQHDGAAALLPPMRAAVAYGSVISRDGDYFGPVVNLAARLVDQAPSGETWASSGLMEAVGDALSAEALPPRTLKGFPDPQPAWRLTP